jgi:PIN domain nuclease of toxin-antitoxin system
VVSTLQQDIGLKLCERQFSAIVNMAESLAWTRDPFDRIIVGQAAIRNDLLLSKDETIRAHYNGGVW